MSAKQLIIGSAGIYLSYLTSSIIS